MSSNSRGTEAEQTVRAEEQPERDVARLRVESAILRAIGDSSPLGIYMVEARTEKIVYFNERLCEMYGMHHLADGLRSGELGHHDVLRHCAELVEEGALSEEACASLWQRARSGHAEVEVRLRDGRVIRWLASPIRDADGRRLGMLFQDEDITERKRIEAHLQEADRLASVGLLVAGVAHEINNPIAYMLLNLERLQASLRRPGCAVDVEELTPLVELTHDGAKRVRDIVRDLGAFARGGKDTLAPVDVRDPLDAAIRMASHALDDQATLARDCTPAPPVLANEAWLAQLFMNLLLNAAHAVADAPEKTIQVSIRPDDECVAIEIRDTGRGIPRTSLARIFDPFFTTKPTGEGLGLGLWISRSIVTALGGKISVESEVGVGTTVRVSLPAAGGVAP